MTRTVWPPGVRLVNWPVVDLDNSVLLTIHGEYFVSHFCICVRSRVIVSIRKTHTLSHPLTVIDECLPPINDGIKSLDVRWMMDARSARSLGVARVSWPGAGSPHIRRGRCLTGDKSLELSIYPGRYLRSLVWRYRQRNTTFEIAFTLRYLLSSCTSTRLSRWNVFDSKNKVYP